MNLKFVEVTNGFNWGKFAVGQYTHEEWTRRSEVDDLNVPLLAGRGFSRQFVWVFDLQTGEAALFRPGGHAVADLNKHAIWVCPMFEHFLTWLYEYYSIHLATWWEELPQKIDLPNAPSAMHGYRRPGGGEQ